MRIIVVGAGILGLTTAHNLLKAGANVTIVDCRPIGHGTSGTSFAWTNASGKLNPAYHALNVAGMQAHRELAAELPGPSSYVESGGLQIADAEQSEWLRERLEKLTELGYPYRLVSSVEGRRVSGLPMTEDPGLVAYFPQEGYVRPRQLLRGLAAAASAAGAKWESEAVESLGFGDSNMSVTLANKKTLRADRVVLAAGRWSKTIAASAGITVPMDDDTGARSAAIGVIGVARAPQTDVRAVVHSSGLNLRPSWGDKVIVQALDLNQKADPHHPPQPGGQIAVEMARRFSVVTGVPLAQSDLELRLSYRSLPADGFPIVGPVDSGSLMYTVVSHSGVTLAPVLGRLAAAEIMTGARQPLLEPFRLDRFAHDNVTVSSTRTLRLGEQ